MNDNISIPPAPPTFTSVPTTNVGTSADYQREPQDETEENRPKVTIFHDSLCHKINPTMMNNEKVIITKVLSPTLSDTQKNVDELEEGDTDRIVIQGMTREVGGMDTDEYAKLTFTTVDKCLTKAEKVVVSLIVDREDDPGIRAKAEAVNALIKLEYMNTPNVFVCNNDNLRDRKYKQKRDFIHLTEAGTSRLANNLKYKIAESLGIQVVKKIRNMDRDGYDRRQSFYVDRRFMNNNNYRYKNDDSTNDNRYKENSQYRQFRSDKWQHGFAGW